jgi:hypothetical protein
MVVDCIIEGAYISLCITYCKEFLAMAGKAKGIPRDTTVTLRLPRELHNRLKEAARGKSVSEEMRARLEWSLLHDWRNDPKTGSVIDAIGNLARNVAGYYGAWHQDPYAFKEFKIAVDIVLTKVRPKGEPIPPVDNGEFRPDAKALATAEIIARGL